MIQYGPRKAGFTAAEVRQFMRVFPCSGLYDRAYWFEFAENGDLVDTDVPEHSDGPGAAALAQDAQRWLNTGDLPNWLEQ